MLTPWVPPEPQHCPLARPYSHQAVPGEQTSLPVSSGVPVGRREPWALMKLGGQGGTWPSVSCSRQGAETGRGGPGAQLSPCPRPRPPPCCSSCSRPTPRGGSLGSSLLGWALSRPGGQSRVPLTTWDAGHRLLSVPCSPEGHQIPPLDPAPLIPPVPEHRTMPEPPHGPFCAPQAAVPCSWGQWKGGAAAPKGLRPGPRTSGSSEGARGLCSSLAAPYSPSAMGSAQLWWWGTGWGVRMELSTRTPTSGSPSPCEGTGL